MEINTFLFLMQLIYKHSSPNDQHMTSYWILINKILEKMCISRNIFNRIHFFAICDAFTCVMFVFIWYHIWSNRKLTKQLRQTFFSLIIYNYITLLFNCINTAALAEHSLHHNIIVERLDHSSVSRVCTKKVISDSLITSLQSTEREKEKIILLVRWKWTSKMIFFLSSIR